MYSPETESAVYHCVGHDHENHLFLETAPSVSSTGYNANNVTFRGD